MSEPIQREQQSEPLAPQATSSETIASLTDDELAEAKRYGRQELVCTVLDRALDVAYLAVIAFSVAQPLDRWLMSFSILEQFASLRLLALLLIVTAVHTLVSLPLAYYSGYTVEHRFSLSNQTRMKWLWRYGKRLVLATVFATIVFLGLFWIIWTCQAGWWLVGAGEFFLMSVLLGQLVPVLILPLFYKIERLSDADLGARFNELTRGTGLSIEGVYRMALSEETVKANAMLAGLGATRRVLLGDTLLNRFTPDEIGVIFSHEVGHHVCRHIRKMILAGVVYSAVGFWICDRILATWVASVEGSFSYTTLPVHTLPFVMLVLTVFALVIEPLQNWISRRYERQADWYALERTNDKAAYTSAFRKLARINKDDPNPHWLEVVLLRSHPPIAQRLAMAESLPVSS